MAIIVEGINYWNKEHKQVYLLGNAVTWWAATLSIITLEPMYWLLFSDGILVHLCQQINMFSISMCKLFHMF